MFELKVYIDEYIENFNKSDDGNDDKICIKYTRGEGNFMQNNGKATTPGTQAVSDLLLMRMFFESLEDEESPDTGGYLIENNLSDEEENSLEEEEEFKYDSITHYGGKKIESKVDEGKCYPIYHCPPLFPEKADKRLSEVQQTKGKPKVNEDSQLILKMLKESEKTIDKDNFFKEHQDKKKPSELRAFLNEITGKIKDKLITRTDEDADKLNNIQSKIARINTFLEDEENIISPTENKNTNENRTSAFSNPLYGKKINDDPDPEPLYATYYIGGQKQNKGKRKEKAEKNQVEAEAEAEGGYYSFPGNPILNDTIHNINENESNGQLFVVGDDDHNNRVANATLEVEGYRLNQAYISADYNSAKSTNMVDTRGRRLVKSEGGTSIALKYNDLYEAEHIPDPSTNDTNLNVKLGNPVLNLSGLTSDVDVDASNNYISNGKDQDTPISFNSTNHPGEKDKFKYFDTSINFSYNFGEIVTDMNNREPEKGIKNFNTPFLPLFSNIKNLALNPKFNKGNLTYCAQINIAHYILRQYIMNCCLFLTKEEKYGFKNFEEVSGLFKDIILDDEYNNIYDPQLVNKMQFCYYYMDRKTFFNWVSKEGYEQLVTNKLSNDINDTIKNDSPEKYLILRLFFSMISGIHPSYISVKEEYTLDDFEKYKPFPFIVGFYKKDGDQFVPLPQAQASVGGSRLFYGGAVKNGDKDIKKLILNILENLDNTEEQTEKQTALQEQIKEEQETYKNNTEFYEEIKTLLQNKRDEYKREFDSKKDGIKEIYGNL